MQLDTTREFMRTLLDTFATNVQPLGVLLFGEPEHARTFYAKHLRPLLAAAIDASEATITRWPHRDYDVHTAMNAAFGMAFWLALTRTLDSPTDDLNTTADKLADILFNGLKAR